MNNIFYMTHECFPTVNSITLPVLLNFIPLSVNQCWTEQRFLAKRSQANKRFWAKSMHFKVTNVASFKPTKREQIIFNDDIFLRFVFFLSQRSFHITA